MIYFCNLCGFEVPADKIGAELMKAHLKDEHDDPSQRVEPKLLTR